MTSYVTVALRVLVMRELLKRIPGVAGLKRILRPAPRELSLRKMPRGSIVAEIGVHEGDYSKNILDVTKPKILHLIDPWKHEAGEQYNRAWYGGLVHDGQRGMDQRYASVKKRFEKELRSGQVVLHRKASNLVVQCFQDSYFDWIYIDGNHLCEFVRQDLELYYPKVKCGGYITGHDYGSSGWWNNGVQKAVDEFVSDRALSLVVNGSQFTIRKEP